MPKLRYSWPFYFAIFGNLLMWEELTQGWIYSLIQDLSILKDREYFVIGLLTFICVSMFFITVYQLWINRFKNDKRWLLVIVGLIFLAVIFLLVLETFGSPNPDYLLMVYGLWCLLLMFVYGLRQRAKPIHLKSKFTLPKNITVMVILGGGVLIGLLTLAKQFNFSFYKGRNGDFIGFYALILQIGLPLAMLLNMLDHHARYKGRGFAKKQLDLIERLGED